jgi:hypothetical protein
MARPRLTFACELDAARLTALFANGSVLEDLRALDGRVALMLSDFSEARAAVVRQLNAAAIPVIAILRDWLAPVGSLTCNACS